MERKLTQSHLAEILYVSPKTVDYYERRAANPSADFLVKVADALSVSPCDLLEYDVKTQGKPGPKSRLEILFGKVMQLPDGEKKYVARFLEQTLHMAKE